MNDQGDPAMKELLKKLINRETITYGIFGVLTTVVNYGACFIFDRFTDMDILIYNIIAWVAAVLFAYITNKLWVFESRSWELKVIGPEFASFVGARLLSFLFEEGFLALATRLWHMNDLIAKAVACVFVIIFNYFASKFFIFSNKGDKKQKA